MSIGVLSAFVACALHGHHIDFKSLEGADRLEILTRNEVRVKTVTDPLQIRAALQFIETYESGWKDPLRGPLAPEIKLMFYQGSQGLGGFGIGKEHVVSDPPTKGFWARDVPADQIRRLVRTLGLREDLKY
jgi:hypothetical protein